MKAKQINKIIEDTKVFRKIFKMTEEDSVCNNIKIISLGKNPCRIGKAWEYDYLDILLDFLV